MENDNRETNPSTELLLEVAKDEYSKERERSISLDNKSGIFIAASIAMCTVFIPIIPFGKVLNYYTVNQKTDFVSIMLVVLAVAFGLIAYSFYKLFRSISLKNFNRVDIDSLKDNEIQMQEPSITAAGLIEHYHSIIKNNTEINKGKAEQLVTGIQMSLIGFLLLSVATISLLIVMR